MWLVFLLYVAAGLGLAAIADTVGGPLPWVALALGHLLFALEGNSLRRWKLSARGYAFVGVAEGRRNEAELRFFSQWQQPAAAAAEVPPAATGGEATLAPARTPQPPMLEAPKAEPAKPSPEAGEVIGLFPAPGGSQ